MFELLQQFIEAHHRLPQRREELLDESVFLWMCRMRSKHEKGKLTTEEIERFSAMSVDPLEGGLRQQRRKTMAELEEFYNHAGRWPGHSDDPREEQLYETLKRWRARVRFNPQCVLAADLHERLPELLKFFTSGTAFHSAKDHSFEQRLLQVEEFYIEHGRLPSASRTNQSEYRLNRWYQRANKLQREGALNSYKLKALIALNARISESAKEPA